MASPFMARPTMAPQQGLLARIQAGLMPAPSGASLLADSGARPQGTAPGFMQSVGRAIQAGQGTYQGAQQGMLGQRAAEQQMQLAQQQLDAGKASEAQRARLQQVRQSIIAEHPLPADVGGMAKWVEAVLPKFMAEGDEEYVQRLSAIRSTLGNGQAQQKEPGQWVEVTGPDGKPMTRYVTASEAGQGLPVYEKPQRDTNEELTVNSRILREEGLEKNYEKRVEGVQSTVDAYLGAVQAAKMGGSGDLQILYSFIRALDPNSVVREGEVALARQSASVWSNAHILKSKLETQGGTLSPVQREQMLELMKQMVELKAERARAAYKNAQSRSQRFGLDVYLHNPLEAYDAFKAQQEGGDFGAVQGGGSSTGGPGTSNVESLRGRYGSVR
jgi:hypothetical protein